MSDALDPHHLNDFVIMVQEIAQQTQVGFFGRYKVFIAPVWDKLRHLSQFKGWTYEQFQRQLVKAHLAGMLKLSRADLTPAMDPDMVARSEIYYLNGLATFHLIDLE